ncbi:MAG: hypothetical protein M0R66_04420 [Candidatus Omnitrophica bacterium]|nr:hypothetical protein [Candidatus Omnitrophota bacterium]
MLIIAREFRGSNDWIIGRCARTRARNSRKCFRARGGRIPYNKWNGRRNQTKRRESAHYYCHIPDTKRWCAPRATFFVPSVCPSRDLHMPTIRRREHRDHRRAIFCRNHGINSARAAERAHEFTTLAPTVARGDTHRVYKIARAVGRGCILRVELSFVIGVTAHHMFEIIRDHIAHPRAHRPTKNLTGGNARSRGKVARETRNGRGLNYYAH